MAEGKGRKPSHRIVIQHDPDNDKNQTEIGAMWPHKTGGGFSILIKPGLAAVGMDPEAGIRIVAFSRSDDDDDERPARRGGRQRSRRSSRRRERGGGESDEDEGEGDAPPPRDEDAPRERSRSRGDDDIPY